MGLPRKFLKKRIGLIDGVVFSGGEPLTDPALYEAVQTAKKLGYKIGLHTAGMYPHQLREILPFLDWVGLDIKAPLLERDLYEKVVGKRVHIEKVEESLDDLLESGIPFEVRTTAHPDYLSEEQLLALAMQLKERGVRGMLCKFTGNLLCILKSILYQEWEVTILLTKY